MFLSFVLFHIFLTRNQEPRVLSNPDIRNIRIRKISTFKALIATTIDDTLFKALIATTIDDTLIFINIYIFLYFSEKLGLTIHAYQTIHMKGHVLVLYK